MSVNKTEKKELLEKLNLLLHKQSQFQKEINELQLQVATLQVNELDEPIHFSEDIVVEKRNESLVRERKEIEKIIQKNRNEKKGVLKEEKTRSAISNELEKFIGENLINKIGIAVLIIGVGIGVKYAIDNDLISPLVRIILGYIVGFGLAGFAIRLKSKYLNFSAVLFSGAMAIQYFITYAATIYYQLFPQMVAIVLMGLITILTVALALYCKQEVIAHFGLVGAYIIPYLLKDPFLNVTILFTYMVIINSGILFISTKKKWKPLNCLSFVATWIIFISWFASKNYQNQLGTCLTFLGVFFLIFYLVFLSYKILLKEKFRIDDIFLLLINSFIFYIVGYIALNSLESSKEYLGLFTLVNAIVHGSTAYLIYKTKSSDKNLFYWTVGLVIAFITIAVSVQFNNFITAILWSVEAALIFWFGRSKKINIYENISFFIIFITTLITAINWTSTSYNLHSKNIDEVFTPILNSGFIASLIVLLSFCFIYYYGQKSNNKSENKAVLNNIFDVVFPIVFLLVLYFTFFIEISLYWNNVQINAAFEVNSAGIWEKQFDKLNFDITKFRGIWLLNYTLLFASLLSFANFKWIRNKDFYTFILVFNSILTLIFLGSGLIWFAQLRASYLQPELAPNYDVSIYYLIIRYVSMAFFAVLFYSTYRFVIAVFNIKIFRKIFEVALTVSIVWLFSSELINWLHLSGSNELYKHGLSILWGVFSFILVAYGIWKKKKHIRITAIALFTITLAKLFFYDLTNLKTVPKTIVFVSIGILLLVVSFMYNKYKNIISDEN